MRTAFVAGTAAVAGLATALPALAAPIPTVQVPCRVSALASAISGASNGEVLRLASCTYVLNSELPMIVKRLTLQGSTATTIERSYAGGTPHFSLLNVAGGSLTVTDVNFADGYAPTEAGPSTGRTVRSPSPAAPSPETTPSSTGALSGTTRASP